MHRFLLLLILIFCTHAVAAQGTPTLAAGANNPAPGWLFCNSVGSMPTHNPAVEIRFVGSTTTTVMPTITEIRVNNVHSTGLVGLVSANLWVGDLGGPTAMISTVNLTGASGPITFGSLSEQVFGGETFLVEIQIDCPNMSGGECYELRIGPSDITWSAGTVPGSIVTGGAQTVYDLYSIATSTVLPSGIANSAYSQQFAVTGGYATYGGLTSNWSASGLPTGWTMSATGLLAASASDVVQGTYSFNVTAFSPMTQETATDTFGVTIIQGSPQLQVTTTALGDITLGLDTYFTLSATGGNPPYQWSSTNLPSTFTLQQNGTLNTGHFSLPAGTGTFNVTVTDSASASQGGVIAYNIVVPPPLVIMTQNLPPAIVGESYSATITASGGATSQYGWGIQTGMLPPGLTGVSGLGHPSTTISGIPTSAGDYDFTVIVADGASAPAYQMYTLSVVAPSASTSSGSDDSGGGGCAAAGAGAPWALLLLLLYRMRRREVR